MNTLKQKLDLLRKDNALVCYQGQLNTVYNETYISMYLNSSEIYNK